MAFPLDSVFIHLERLINAFNHSERDQLHCNCSPPPLMPYLMWLAATFCLDNSELFYAAAYLRRLCHMNRRPRGIQRCTPYRLVLAAVIVAHKYLKENSYKNVDWGRGFDMSAREVDRVEWAMLNLLRCELRVSDDELRAVKSPFYHALRHPVRQKKIGLRRENAIVGHACTGREIVVV